jgi:hypothetical protein
MRNSAGVRTIWTPLDKQGSSTERDLAGDAGDIPIRAACLTARCRRAGRTMTDNRS